MNLPAHRAYLRRFGLLAWIHDVSASVLHRLIGFKWYLVYFVPAHLTDERAETPYVIRELTRGDLSRIAEVPGWDLAESFLNSATARGETCLGAFADGDLCGYAWYSGEPCPVEKGVAITFPRHLCYGHKYWTMVPFRGRGVQKAIAGKAKLRARAAGQSGLVVLIESRNVSSRRTTMSVGGRVVGWQLLLGRAAWGSRGSRRLGVELVR